MKKLVTSFLVSLGVVGALAVSNTAQAADTNSVTLNVEQLENTNEVNWLLESKNGSLNTTLGPGGLKGSGSGIQGPGRGIRDNHPWGFGGIHY